VPLIPYFHGYSWSALSREERFYCFTLYEHARVDPTDFARWVAKTAKPKFSITGEDEWDIGVEVCLYRDFLWHKDRDRKESARKLGFSPKRTFDICLFGKRTIIIIEAKVFQGFDTKQNKVFGMDRERIRRLPEMKDVEVILVALASSKSRYFAKFGDGESPEPFKGWISWEDAFEKYGDELMLQANKLYGSGKRRGDRLLETEQG
jgi:hypothetical protein